MYKIHSTLTLNDVIKAIMKWPGLYERRDGTTFKGMPVSQVPSQLRECGWHNVSHLGEGELEHIGLVITEARYIGGARAKRFCRVVVAD